MQHLSIYVTNNNIIIAREMGDFSITEVIHVYIELCKKWLSIILYAIWEGRKLSKFAYTWKYKKNYGVYIYVARARVRESANFFFRWPNYYQIEVQNSTMHTFLGTSCIQFLWHNIRNCHSDFNFCHTMTQLLLINCTAKCGYIMSFPYLMKPLANTLEIIFVITN